MDPQAPAPAPVSPPGAYPLTLGLDAPLKVARWRPLVHGILAIPHLFVMYGLSVLQGVITLIAFFAVLFTKKFPEGMFQLGAMCMRYSWRTMSYYLYMREDYPPFEFDTVTADPGTDAAKLSIEYPQEMNRWLPLVKWFLAIPHYFVLFFLILGGLVVYVVSFFAVIITGKYPQGMRDYMVGIARWCTRVNAYTYLMTDQYPPFSLD